MSQFLKKILNRETISYLVFGVLTTIVDLVVFYAMENLGFHYQICYWVSWAISVIFAYITNKLFVFESKDLSFVVIVREFLSFVACRIFSGVVSDLLLTFLVEIVKIPGFSMALGTFTIALTPTKLAKLITEVFVVVSNYVFSKLLIFRKKA